jgi:hypothetical protein
MHAGRQAACVPRTPAAAGIRAPERVFKTSSPPNRARRRQSATLMSCWWAACARGATQAALAALAAAAGRPHRTRRPRLGRCTCTSSSSSNSSNSRQATGARLRTARHHGSGGSSSSAALRTGARSGSSRHPRLRPSCRSVQVRRRTGRRGTSCMLRQIGLHQTAVALATTGGSPILLNSISADPATKGPCTLTLLS